MDKLVNQIIDSLKIHSDPKRKGFAVTVYPTSMEVIGVVNAHIKDIIREIKTETKSWSAQDKIALAKALVATDIFECQQIAYEFLGKDIKTKKELTEADLDALAKNLDNWVSVDGFGVYLVGPSWREGIIDDQKILSYQQSENYWIRRVALVSTVALNLKSQGGTGDTGRTLMICTNAVSDHHDMINKALSWALRELSKRDKEVVTAFIGKHEKSMHSRVLREVRNKLETGRKYP